MSNLKIKKYFIAAFFFMMPQLTSAQIEDWIEDQVTEYAENYIDEISGGLYSKAKEFYYNPIGTIWESYIQSDVKTSVNEKAAELKNFKVNEKELTRLRNKY